MQVKTVGQLIDALKKHPRNKPLYGYNGSDDDDIPIDVYEISYKEDGLDKPDGVVINVSH